MTDLDKLEFDIASIIMELADPSVGPKELESAVSRIITAVEVAATKAVTEA